MPELTTDEINRKVAELRGSDDVVKHGDGSYWICYIAPITDHISEWPYSPDTNITQAKELLDEMVAAGYSPCIGREVIRSSGETGWDIELTDPNAEKPAIYEIAPLMETSWCLAYIAFKEAKK